MNRKKLFIENIFAYGFISVLNKTVPFILLPVVTRMLPNTSDFGVYSMYTTIIGFGAPLAILGLYDAMFREFFEKDDLEYRFDVTTTTQRIIMFSSIFFSLLLVVFNSPFSILFFGTAYYSKVLILAGIGIFLTANNSPLSAPTRMMNQKKVFVFSGLLSSILLYAVAIILIYFGYSYLGLIYSSIISGITLFLFFWIRNRDFFLKGKFNKEIAKKLLKIGLPLMPTFLIYWIYNSMDKIMITNILDTTQLGIYSIGAKIAQLSTLIYAAFAGGYQFFAFSTMKDNDQVRLNSKLFDYLAALSLLSLLIIYPFIKIGFSLLFEGNYILGYIVVPYLFIAPLLLMLFQIVANQFLIIKKSYLATLSLLFGAIINVLLNIVLIKRIGIEGAAVATFIGYIVTIVSVMFVSVKLKCMIFSNRTKLILSIGPIYIIIQRLWFFDSIFENIIIMLIFVVLLMTFYNKELKNLIRFIKLKVGK